MKQKESKDSISLILSLLAILIPTITFLISSPEKITPAMITIFAFIGIFLLIFYIYSNIKPKWAFLTKNLLQNNREIEEIKNSLKQNVLYNDMDVRLRVIENLLKNKRGQIDPKIIFWILLAILLYLFLKSIGILP